MKSLQDIKNQKVMVRVLDSINGSQIAEKRAMIGGEYEVRTTHHYDNTRTVWDKDKKRSYIFNESDLQVLTPLKYKDRFIG